MADAKSHCSEQTEESSDDFLSKLTDALPSQGIMENQMEKKMENYIYIYENCGYTGVYMDKGFPKLGVPFWGCQ